MCDFPAGCAAVRAKGVAEVLETVFQGAEMFGERLLDGTGAGSQRPSGVRAQRTCTAQASPFTRSNMFMHGCRMRCAHDTGSEVRTIHKGEGDARWRTYCLFVGTFPEQN